MNYINLKNSVSSAIQETLNGYGTDNKKIVVKKITFGDQNLNKLTSYKSIQKIKNKNQTLDVPIFANIEIKDGKKTISKNTKINIGRMPILTPNQSVLVDGVEYIVPFQLRRDPGIYTSQSANGTWITSINSAKGRNFKVESDHNNGVQRINIDGTKIPILPVLHQFGFNKNQIIKNWGGDETAKLLYGINEKVANTATGKKAFQTLYKKLIYGAKPNASIDEMKSALHDYMNNKSEFSPFINKITLGKSYQSLTPETFLDISKKLVNVSNKKEETDDTENLLFKSVRSGEDLIKEKIRQDFKQKLTASLTRNLKNYNDVKDIIRPGMFTKTLKGFFNESQISEPSEQVNPLHIINTASKITLKGEGGITDEHTVSLAMKSLHPSYFGLIDPLHTPDGNAGLVNHLAIGAGVAKNGKLANYYYNKKGKIEAVDITKTWNSKVSFPDQYVIKPGKAPVPKSSKIKVFEKGESRYVSPKEVDYILLDSTHMFDPATNMVPFINSNSGNRISMAGKMGEQAISLINREVPNVSTLGSKNQEIVARIGRAFSVTSPVDGKVVKIKPDQIVIKDNRNKKHVIELREHMELNQESFFHDEPLVKIGQKIKKGDLLAKNNWTDNSGKLALGVNARVAYMPYKGYSIEDGVVIRQGFAEKLASQHIHVQEVNIKEGGLNLNKFKNYFKNKYPIEAYSKLDDKGVVKKSSVVNRGDLLVAYSAPVKISEEEKLLGRVVKGFKNRQIDQSIVWNYDFPGTVIDVVKSNNLVKVKIKSIQAAQLTDKLAGRYGNKGVISHIVGDGDMPRTKDGKPIDVIFNVHGVTSRINPGQLFEASLGKIAERTGKRYLMKNFENNNAWEYVKKQLKDNNISDTEPIIDPQNNKELKMWNPKKKTYEHPFVGNAYIYKLVHQTRKKFDARGRGAYSFLDLPGKDPEASHYIGDSASKANPKSVDRLTLYSLLAHGAKNVVYDMWNNKGQNRSDVWEAIINGAPIPPPKISTATKKFFALNQAAGINSQRKGRFIIHPPLTDKDTLEMSAGKIPKPNLFLRGKDLVPIKGGMFDPNITGGSDNTERFNHIDMEAKIPNPITKNAIKSLLDINDDEFEKILKGTKKDLNGLTGTEWFEKKLSSIDVDSEIKRLEEAKKRAPKTKLNIYNRKLRYLRSLKMHNLNPKDYMISKIPVLPTRFRPILALPSGSIEPNSLNYLYKDIALASRFANEKSFPKFLKNEAKNILYKTVSGLQGVTEPTNPLKGKVVSALTELAGSGSPKGGFFHDKVLSKTQDYIGNSVIGVGPELGVDEVGIPYRMAEIMYEPFVLRELKAAGYKAADYNKIKKENPQVINNILQKIVEERPVILNRNPSLHKGSTIGFYPKLIHGQSIKLNPLILKPLNADFDGDQTPIHVPISKQAVEEAKRMIPSLNVLSPKNDDFTIAFDQEYMAGLALMSELGKKTNYRYKDIHETKSAYDKNKIRINDQIKIAGKNTTYGRALLQLTIPKELGYDGKSVLDNSLLKKILNKMVEKGSASRYTEVINKLKTFGAKYSHDEGFSFSLDDFKPHADIRVSVLNSAVPRIVKDKGFDLDLANSTAQKAQNILEQRFKEEGNRMYLPKKYGSRKLNPDVLMQMTVSPFFVAGVQDKPVKIPIGKSYAEGLDIHDNFIASYGARKAIVDKVNSVSEPGALSKELIASFSGENISMRDCGTHEGVTVPISNTFDLQGRVLAKNANGLKANTILDKHALITLRRGKEKNIVVRSPLTCKAPKGVCALCYGLNEHEELPQSGDPIGLKAAHSIGETGTQSALSSHHLGGTVSAGSFRTGFELTKFLLHMPQTVKNKATLAEADGEVKSIKEGLNKSFEIYINDRLYICRNKPLVKVGDKIKKGQPLDSGPIKIQELADLAPMKKVRDHMVSELEKSYGGTKILKRNTETIVKGVTGYAKVVDPGQSPYLEEEVVPINFVNWIKDGKPISTDDSVGWKLKKKYDKYEKGSLITVDVANDLFKKGIKEVEVNADGLELQNKLIGINQIPLVQPDLLKRMAFQRIRQGLKEGPISGMVSHVHGNYPEPALTIGTEFGLPGYGYY